MCGLGGDTLAYRTGSHQSGFSYPLLAVALKGLTAASRPLSLIPRLSRLRLGPLAAQGSTGTLRHARVFSGSSPSDHIPNIKNDACVRRFNVCGTSHRKRYHTLLSFLGAIYQLYSLNLIVYVSPGTMSYTTIESSLNLSFMERVVKYKFPESTI